MAKKKKTKRRHVKPGKAKGAGLLTIAVSAKERATIKRNAAKFAEGNISHWLRQRGTGTGVAKR